MKNIGLLLTISLFILSTGCNSGGGFGSNRPQEVLAKFLDALAKKDIEEAKKHVTKDSEPMMNMVKMGINMAGESENQIFKNDSPVYGDPLIEGDKATVPVSSKNSGDKTNFILKKENGEWKVAFDKATVMEMGGDKMKQNGQMGMPDNLPATKEELQNALESFKNLSKEDMEKATKALDSIKSVFKEMNKDGKMDKMMEDAGKMMEQMQKKAQ